MNPKLVVISAPSGAGKTTLCQRLLKDFPDQLTLSISSTTRAPRGQEQDGREYHFLTREEFEKQMSQNLFAEWAKVHGNYYGTSRAVVEAAFKRGLSVLLDIDVQGASSLHKSFPGRCLRIFISPPDLKTLEARLRARGTESEESLAKRMRNAEAEMARAVEFDAVILNDELDRAYGELKQRVAEALATVPKGAPRGRT